MSKTVLLRNKSKQIITTIYSKSKQADDNRETEHYAAIKIQSWYRGLRIRSYFKHLNENALKIQKAWRGHQGRQLYRLVLDDAVRYMRFKFYDDTACLIQKHWRGYYSRKYIFNYYKRKEYLAVIKQKNEIVLGELKEYKEYMERQREEKKNILKYKRLEEEAKRNHHLISTKQIPGVFNSPYKPSANEMEYLMRSVKLDPSVKHDAFVNAMHANKFENVTLPKGCLPPLVQKPQGPFREPIDVLKQRYRPFSPTLRCEHDIDSVKKERNNMRDKEWCGRLHDNIFLPVDKSIYNKPYEPLMLTKDKYEKLDYGLKHYRVEADQNDGERFKSLVPPIPEFNKLNKTYVESQHYYMS